MALGLGAGFDPAGPAGETRLLPHVDGPIRITGLLLIPMAGGLIAGWLCHRFAPEAKGHGTDAAIDAFHHRDGFIRSRVPPIKMLATAISLGTGGSGGREGPIAQVGAGFGSFLGRMLHLTPRQRRILLAAGMGAGVGCIFRAPLAGALFSAEVFYREAEFETDVVLPSFISCAIAYCMTCGFLGEFRPLFLLNGDLVFHDPKELLGYTALALSLIHI